MDTLKELKELFRATASVNTPEGLVARQEFCAALKTPILQEVKFASTARELFAQQMLEPGAQAR